jgi:acyl carrier protein
MGKSRRVLSADICALRASEGQFKDIYRVIFSHEDRIFCETATMLKIHTLTNAAAKQTIEAMAAALTLHYGQAGRYIGLYGANSVRWIVLFWAILRSGNRAYLINTRQPRAFTESVLRTLGADVVLCCDEAIEMDADILTYADLKAASDTLSPLPEDAPFGNELALTTSGTTMQQKICIYRGENFTEQLCSTPKLIKENPGLIERFDGKFKQLAFLPLYHIFGFSAMYLWYAFLGATLVFPPSLAPDVLLRTVRRHEVTHIFAVPMLWHAVEKSVMKTVEKQDDKAQKNFRCGIALSIKLQRAFPKAGKEMAARLFRDVRARLFGDSVRFCISGGSGIESDTLQLINALGYPLYNGYGMSEIGITSVELSHNLITRLRGTIGRPFPFVSYRVSENGHLLVKGCAGCDRLVVDGVEQPREEWFDTGDLVRVDPDGRYAFEGRASDIIIGEDGENINPDMIRATFDLPGAKAFEVLADPQSGSLMLLVCIDKAITDGEWEQLQSHIAEDNADLPHALRVRTVKFTYDPLMRESDIKISRTYLAHALRSGTITLIDHRRESERTGDEESSPLKEQLRTLVAQTLEINPSDVADNANFFTELGGSSLDYYTLVGRIDEQFGVRMPFEVENCSYCINDFEILVKELLSHHA